MHTVAEGIETQAQADVVAELGCDKGQGYWFSKPLPAGEIAMFIENFGKEPTAMRRLSDNSSGPP
jgi:EAL domain-containing protein (putative c-di-GMP-specific phosphodiesterase class I)